MANKSLLCTMFMLGLTLSASAKTYSQKTFLAPRPVGVNLPMEKSTWHEYAYQKLDLYGGHTIKTHFQITPFYQASSDKHDTGAYFGIGKGNSFSVAQYTTVPANKGDIVGGNLIHDVDANGNDISDLAGKVTFNPKQEIWGVRLDYFQDVQHPCKKLFFRASMPVVYVENDMNLKIENQTKVTVGGKEFGLADFFAGKVNVTQDMDAENMQTGLTKAKIDGERTKFGIGDIELGLGYKIHQTKKDHVFLSLGLTIPVADAPTGDYLFEPVCGNNKHIGLGFRLDSSVNLWEGQHGAIRALFDVDYHYLFDATEHRTLSPKHTSDMGYLGYYYLAAKNGQKDNPLFPAANVLTQPLRIKPGSQLDAMFALSFKSSGFVIDLGYDLYYRDEEGVWLKEWTDNVYGISQTDYFTSLDFGPENAVGDSLLIKESIDIDACKTPSQITNKIFAGFGYQFNFAKKVPGLVGIGGSYEFVCDNSALEQYAVWLKLGVSF